MDHDGAAPPERSTATEHRRFRDEAGIVWTVREVRAPTYDRRRGPSLIFANDVTMVMRRVRNYPKEWRSLSDAELSALSHQR